MVGVKPKTHEKTEQSVRGDPKTSRKPKLFYAIASGRRIGVFSNKWSETECLTKHYKGARFKGFKDVQEAWKFILAENKTAPYPDSLNDFCALSEDELSCLRDQMLKDKEEKDDLKDNPIT